MKDNLNPESDKKKLDAMTKSIEHVEQSLNEIESNKEKDTKVGDESKQKQKQSNKEGKKKLRFETNKSTEKNKTTSGSSSTDNLTLTTTRVKAQNEATVTD